MKQETRQELLLPKAPASKSRTTQKETFQQMVAGGGGKAPVQSYPQRGRTGDSHNDYITHPRPGSATDQTPVPAFLSHRGDTAPVFPKKKEPLRHSPLGSQEADHSPCPRGEKYITANAETEVSVEGELPEGTNALRPCGR